MTDEEFKNLLNAEIDEVNSHLDNAERLLAQLEPMRARRARLIASRDALLPAPKVEQRAKAEPSNEVVVYIFQVLQGGSVTFAALARSVIGWHPSTTKPEITVALRRLEKAGKITREGSGKATRYVAVVASE